MTGENPHSALSASALALLAGSAVKGPPSRRECVYMLVFSIFNSAQVALNY